MGRPSEYPEELRARAARMLAEIRPDYRSQWAAICEVAGKLGIGAPETVRHLGAPGRGRGRWPGAPTELAAEVAELKRENVEL